MADVNMWLTVEKGIIGGICHAIHRYAEANNIINTWKIIIKIKICYILCI